MAGVTYDVVTRYSIEDRASGQAGKIAGAFDGLGKYADKVSGAIDGLASKLFSVGKIAAGVAAAGGIAALKVGLVDVNAKIEDVTIGMAGAFRVLGAAGSFDQGLGMAKELLAGIRADAAALPGEFQDFAAMAQTLSAPLVNAGKGVQQIRDLTRDTVVAASSVGVAFDQAAREMAMLLEGHAGGHNVLGTRLGINAHTMVNGKEFNQADAVERYDFITKALANAKDALPAFQKSWSGMTSTLADSMKTLLGKTTAPLFERIKGTLWSIVGDGGLLERNTKRLDRMAESIGKGLVTAYDWLFERGKWLVGHWEQIHDRGVSFAHSLHDAFVKIWPIAEKLGHVFGQRMQDPAGLIKEIVGLRVALAAMSGAGSIAAGASSIMTAVGGAGSAGAAAGAVGGAAAAAAAPLAIAAVAAAGSLDILTQNAKENGLFYYRLQEIALGVWSDVKSNFGKMITELGSFFSDLWTAARPVVDVLGVALIGALDGAILSIRAFTWPLRMLAKGIAWVVSKIPGFSAGGGDDTEEVGVDGYTGEDHKKKKGLVDLKPKDMSALQAELATMAVGAVKGLNQLHGSGAVKVQVTVPMTVLSDADPERLAVGIAKKVKDEFKHATKAKNMGLAALAFE